MKALVNLFVMLLLFSQKSTSEEILTRATIRNPRIEVLDRADPKLPLYGVRFDAMLRNNSRDTIFIGNNSAFLVRVDHKVTSGWKTILTSSWYETDDAEISKCTSVRPRRASVYRHLAAMFAFEASSKPPDSLVQLRFYFESVCQRGSERLRQAFVTEPKEFVLP